jgi:multidrug efflux system outer membrane protein
MPSPPRLPALSPALALVAAGLLAGCSLIPSYERPAPPVPQQFPGATGTAASPSAADTHWREFIEAPRLVRLVEVALANNRDLRVAALRVEQSRAEYRRARSGLFPSLDLRLSSTRQGTGDLPSGAGSTTTSANLSAASTAYELDFFGRVRSGNEQALQQYLETEEAKRSAQISLVAEVATQYFALREAEEQLSLARQTLELVEESYRLNTASFDAGQIDALDLRTSEGQLQNAKINLLTYERQAAQAGNQLVLLIGAPLPEDLPEPEPFGTNVLAEIPAGLPAELAQRRPDILAAEHALLAANANIGVARAAFFPSISLTGSVGRTSDALGTLISAGTGIWSFVPQLTLPLFNAGSNHANLTAAQAAKEIEVANYEQTIQTAFREVADALVAADTYARETDAQQAAIDAQTQRFQLADARYRQGEVSYLTVLQAQQDLYSAQQGRLRAQSNRASSQIALYRALGGGWQ